MKTLVTLACTALLLSTAGTALAQRLDTADTLGWVGDEPNVRSAGRIRAWDGSPSADYPADANNLGADRLDSPDTILAVDWVNTLCTPCPKSEARGTRTLFEQFASDDVIVPGLGQFWAMYGTWLDINADGRIQDHGNRYDRAHVSTNGDCTTAVTTGEESGIGQPQGVNTGVGLRCSGQDEWDPPTPVPIAAYVTPGDWGTNTDSINREFSVYNPLVAAPPRATSESPDFVFQGFAQESTTTGTYFAPSTNAHFVMTTNSLLESLVIEAISDPETVVGGPRTHEASALSLVEVDVYSALDPTVESLYYAALQPAYDATGCDHNLPERGCRRATDPVTEPVRLALAASDATVGPTVGQVQAKWERDPQDLGASRSAPHLFLDLFLDVSQQWEAVGVADNDNNRVATVSEYNNAELSPTADGRTHAWPHVSVMGYFGVWTDENGDGWIGAPSASPGCPDVYDCGNDPTPHEFPQNGKDDRGEFTVDCGAKDIPASQEIAGAFPVTLESSTNSWGNGVYVVTDRRNVLNANSDEFVEDGRSPFNPYDDLAFDASDGNVDGLRTSGPIELHMVCLDNNGFYYSYEHLYWLDGSNFDYAVTVHGGTGGDFTALGVPAGEDVEDVDEIAPAAI